jgi:uncharacterized protein YciI
LVQEHIQHYANFHEQGKLEMGGLNLDNDSGSMMIATKDVSREELEEFAIIDPAISYGLLTFQIKIWYIAMTN